VYFCAPVTVKLIWEPLSLTNAPLLLVRKPRASLVEMRTVFDAGVDAETVMYGVPPTSLPKSSTTAAGCPPDGTVSVAVPLPCTSAWALVTEPWVRTTLTGRTSSLDGAGTRLCQVGLAGQVGSAAPDGLAGISATAAAVTMPATAHRAALTGLRWCRVVLKCCLERSPSCMMSLLM